MHSPTAIPAGRLTGERSKHSTDYYRERAVPKYGPFSKPLPDDVTWPTLIPESALKPLS